jgi:hypothetical protein
VTPLDHGLNHFVATKTDVGLILNFGERKLGVKRQLRAYPKTKNLPPLALPRGGEGDLGSRPGFRPTTETLGEFRYG